MLILITNDNKSEHQGELDKIHVLRHEVFVEQLKWPALTSVNGREFDQYDVPEAVYIAVKEGDDIAAAVRLNWTDKPNLLSDVFGHLVEFERMPNNETTVDLSRFVVSPKYGSRDRMNRHGSDLIAGILEHGVSTGIANYTAVISTHFLSTLLQWGVEAYAMGFPAGEGRDEHLAVRVPVNQRSILNLYRYTGNFTPRLRTPDFLRWFREMGWQPQESSEPSNAASSSAAE